MINFYHSYNQFPTTFGYNIHCVDPLVKLPFKTVPARWEFMPSCYASTFQRFITVCQGKMKDWWKAKFSISTWCNSLWLLVSDTFTNASNKQFFYRQSITMERLGSRFLSTFHIWKHNWTWIGRALSRTFQRDPRSVHWRFSTRQHHHTKCLCYL